MSAGAPWDSALVEDLVRAGGRLHGSALIAGTAGNLSARLTGDALLITRRGTHKGHLDADDLVALSLDVTAQDAAEDATAASTELPFHRACYRARPDVGAVIHSHAPALVAVGVRELDIGAMLPEVTLATGPIVTVPLLESGSEALGEGVGRAVAAGAGVVILQQHGAVSVGANVDEALNRMELAELAAYMVLLTVDGGAAVSAERVVRLTREDDGEL